MKLKTLSLLLATAFVLFGTEAFAESTYGWEAATNEELYNSALLSFRTLQTDLVGEPVYFMAQETMLKIEAAHKSSKYAWMAQIHTFCNVLEAIYCPQLEHPRICATDKYETIRRDIMKLRDFPMHEVSLTTDTVSPESGQIDAFTKSNEQNLNIKRAELFEALRGPRPETDREIQIFKVYSSGFVFRTKSSCVGLDICYEQAFGTTEGASELAGYLDALFITHAHGDHYDQTVLNEVYENGKAIIMSSAIVSPTSGNGKKFIWSSDHLTSTNVYGNISALAKMSAQGTEPCLLYMIDFDGWRIIAVGDSSDKTKESFYSDLEMADIVIAPVFQGVAALVGCTYTAPNPDNIEQVYVNCHENEFHHTIDGRVSYKYLFGNTAALANSSVKYPMCAIIDNGESIVLKK